MDVIYSTFISEDDGGLFICGEYNKIVVFGRMTDSGEIQFIYLLSGQFAGLGGVNEDICKGISEKDGIITLAV